MNIKKIIVIAIPVVLQFSCVSFEELTVDEQLKRIELTAKNEFLKGNMDQAISHWLKGVAIADQGQKYDRLGEFYLELSKLEELKGHYSQAKEYAINVLHLAKVRGNLKHEAISRMAVANVFSRMNQNRAAKQELLLAKPIVEQLGNRQLECDFLRIEGRIEQSNGALDRALSLYKSAFDIAKQLEDRVRISENLNNIGGIHRLKADYAEALEYYRQSLAVREESKDLFGQSKVQGNLCLVYQNLGEDERALEACKRSLMISHKTGDRAREANQLNNLGAIYRKQGKYRQAINNFQRSLDIKLQISDQAGAARSFNNIGEIYWLTANYDNALTYFSKSLQLKQAIGDRPGQAATHYNLALLSMDTHDFDRSFSHLTVAYQLQLATGQPELIWRILEGYSLWYEKQNQMQSAILFGKLSVNTIQGTRTNLQDLNKRLKKSYLKDKKNVYKRLSGLLIEKGRLIEAQQVLNMLKEEEYFDFIRRDPARTPGLISVIACTPSEQDFCQRYHEISADLITIGQRAKILSKKGTHRTPTENSEFQILEADMKIARDRFQSFLSEVKKELLKEPEFYADQVEKKLFSRPAKLQQILTELNPSAVVLHYVVQETKLSIILTTPTQRLVREVAISAKKLRHKIAIFRNLITHQLPVKEISQELYGWIIGPVADDLKASGAQLLMLSLDDALRYLPLAALYDGEKYLAEQYAFSLYNAAANDSDIKDKPQAEWKIVAFGLSEAVSVETPQGKYMTFGALPNVPDELDAIVKENDADHRGILEGAIKLDQSFTDQTFKDMIGEGSFQVIHIASHFNLNPGDDSNSFLVLGKGKILSLARIYNEDIRFQGIDLLVLSACNTAVAEQASPGSEVESFGTIAQNQGAKAILASLWPVSDKSTSDFMQTLYAIRASNRLPKAEAIRQTQLQFIHQNDEIGTENCRGVTLECSDTQSQLRHPYHWSAFVLMGNWL